MPPAIGGLIIAAGATFAGAAVAGAAIGTAALLAGITFGAGALQALFFNNRPSQEGVRQNLSSPTEPLNLVYGEAKVGGIVADTRVDDSSDDRKVVHRVLAFCVGSENGSGVESVEKFWFDERLAVDGPVEQNTGESDTGEQSFFDPHMAYGLHLGTDAQTVDSNPGSLFGSAMGLTDVFPTAWPSTSRLRGVCYANFLLEHDPEIWGGIPNVTALIRGNRVYDPRDPTGGPDGDGWIWDASDATGSPNQNPGQNPALCILDYLTSERYGEEVIYTERDGGSDPTQIDEQSFIDAANYCDELVSGPDPDTGTFQPRFTCDLWLKTGDGENLGALLSTCRGELVEQHGRYRLVIRQQQAPVDFTLDPSNILGDWRWIRSGIGESPNSVVVTYPDKKDDLTTHQVVWPPEEDNDFLPSDAGFRQQMEVQLPGTVQHYRAQEIGQVMLKEAREDVTVEVTCTEAALQLEKGDLVKVTHPTPGWTDKEFWVGSLKLMPPENKEDGQPTRVKLGLKEYADSAYTYSLVSDKPTTPGTNLPDPFTIGVVQNLTLTSDETTQQVTPAGDKVPRVLATWDPPANHGGFYDHAEVYAKRVEDADGNPVSENYRAVDAFVGASEDQEAIFQVGAEDELWEVKVVSVNVRRARSEATAQVTLSTDFVASDLPGTIVDIDLQEDDFDSDGVVEGRMLVDVIASGSYDLQFLTRQGRSTAWTTGNNPLGVSEGDPTETQDVELLESQNSFIALDVFKAGTSEQVGRRIIVTFDPDAVANVTDLSIAVDPDDGSLTAEVAGDADTATIYLTQTTDGSEPTDPTAANADETVNARSGSVTFSGVTVAQSETARVKARGENAAGQLAPASTIKADRAKRTGERSSVNLLGADAGPEHSGTASVIYDYFEGGGGPGVNDKPLSEMALSPGDILSCEMDLRSATGANTCRVGIIFYDSGGTQVGSEVQGSNVDSSTYERSTAEDVEIPATAASIRVFGRNADFTEEAFVRRAMLNRGPIAAPYSAPPSTGDLIGSHTVDVDSAGNVLVSGRRRADVETVYFTVGVGAVPSDPTAASHDEQISGETWEEVDTDVNASPPTLVVVKAVPELASGTLGPVEIAGASAGPWSGGDLPRLPGGVSVADVIQDIADDGQARPGFRIDGFPFNSHTDQKTGRDGNEQAFDQDYNGTPKVHFVPQRALTYLSGESSFDQRVKISANNPSPSTFDLKAVVEHGTTTTSDHEDGFSSSRNTSAPENGGATVSADDGVIYSNLEDADGSDLDITVTYDVDTTNMTGSEFVNGLVTLHFEYSDAATGGNWTEAGTKSYGEGLDLTDEQFNFSATMGPNYDIRIRITYAPTEADGEATITGHGEDGTPPGVQFSVNDSALTETGMTPRTTDRIYWEAKEVSA